MGILKKLKRPKTGDRIEVFISGDPRDTRVKVNGVFCQDRLRGVSVDCWATDRATTITLFAASSGDKEDIIVAEGLLVTGDDLRAYREWLKTRD